MTAIRSKQVLRAAKGEPCTFVFPSICNYNSETTVACHIRDEVHGRGIKANDISIGFGCSACHEALDQNNTGLSEVDLLKSVLRAMQRTLVRLVEKNVIIVPLDRKTEHKIKPRKPKSQRAKIPSRPFQRRET